MAPPPHMNQRFTYSTCSVVAKTLEDSADSAIEATVYGVLTAHAYSLFRADAAHYLSEGWAHILRLDCCAFVMTRPLQCPPAAISRAAPALAFVAPENQMAFWSDYARLVSATYGVTRIVFPAHQLPQAQRWAQRRVQVRGHLQDSPAGAAMSDFGSLI